MKFKIRLITLLLTACSLGFSVYSQPQKIRCNTSKLLEEAKNNAYYIETQRQIKEATKQLQLDKSDTVITIPVVVHVIYKNQAEKIYDDQIFSQIDALNKDFRRLNPDRTIVPNGFSVADVKIEFCLADEHPDGSYSTGIIKTFTTQDDVGLRGTYYTISPSWGNEYLNIWVCDFGNNIAGQATPPGTVPANRDGVIVDYTNFGTIGQVIAPYHLGRTVTHEVGHWLNLIHTWGTNDASPNCSSDDFVTDTPDQSKIYYNCPSQSSSCGSIDMTTNFMGYVDDACMANFTEGQKTRMRAALLGARSSVVSSTRGCRDVGIRENSFARSLEIFPNPNQGSFELITKQNINLDHAELLLFDKVGKSISFKSSVSSNGVRFNTENLASGLYFLQVKKDNFFAIKKIIVNNR